MKAPDHIAAIWFNHEVQVHEPGGMSSRGPLPGATHTVRAYVDASASTVVTAAGEEVTAAATLTWHVDDVLPKPGWTVTLPEAFGLKPNREVVTAARNMTGTGLTPDHIEVTIR